jgi:hypothetical protein
MNWDGILQESKTDALLAGLVDEVREYTRRYIFSLNSGTKAVMEQVSS